MADAIRIERCRSCGAPNPRPFLDLGVTPVANALLDEADLGAPEPRFPLEVAMCESCTLVQLTHVLPADRIFDAAYPYFSSYSDVVVAHAKEHVEGLISSGRLGSDSLIVEVASNDGYLLKHAAEAGIGVLGIEPTPGPAAASRALGIPTVEAFFGEDLARTLCEEGKRADVIVANNVMAHVPDLNSFVAGFRTLVADDGVITVENPWVRDLVQRSEFDTIYHEHVCYLSCTAVDNLMRRHSLSLNDVEYFPDLHGGTLRWWISPIAARTARLERYLAEERAIGMTSFAFYAELGAKVRRAVDALKGLLASLKAEGASIAAYAAAAKGATLLNYAGIDRSTIDFVVDRNVHKQGKYMPGARLPILDPVALVERRPDYVLILAWNFEAEIVAQQQAYRDLGGRFIIPIPEPRIV
ncbi:MAG TPA: class I SAM-dependent methyltransferase [Candidatus Limnocylindrales bacterium]|nr:class I SAM-dependent methyltransferase [Candidatus Limnocylindrales bacterium]